MNDKQIIRNFLTLMDDIMPQMGRIVIQNYALLNETLIAADKSLQEENEIETQSN